MASSPSSNRLNRLSRRDFIHSTIAGCGGLAIGALGQSTIASAAEPIPAKPIDAKKTAETAKPKDTYGDPPPPDKLAQRAFADLPSGAFTLAFLPDTQHYCAKYPQHFHSQTKWLAENAEQRNIKHVLHLGDITNNNNPKQWEVAQAALGRLEGKVPYALCTGNHDVGPNGSAKTRDTLINDYFPLKQYAKQSTFGGAMEEGRIDNNYHVFSAGGHDYLILALEWAPRDRAVEWAGVIAAKYPKHRKILITHAYMYCDENRYDFAKYGKQQHATPHTYGSAQTGGANDGEELWQKLVSKHPGFVIAHNGHVLGDGLAHLVSPGAEKQPVHQMLVNYQHFPEGGQGFMRLIEFSPDGNTLSVKSYSPALDRFKIDEGNEFTLKLG